MWTILEAAGFRLNRIIPTKTPRRLSKPVIVTTAKAAGLSAGPCGPPTEAAGGAGAPPGATQPRTALEKGHGGWSQRDSKVPMLTQLILQHCAQLTNRTGEQACAQVPWFRTLAPDALERMFTELSTTSADAAKQSCRDAADHIEQAGQARLQWVPGRELDRWRGAHGGETSGG